MPKHDPPPIPFGSLPPFDLIKEVPLADRLPKWRSLATITSEAPPARVCRPIISSELTADEARRYSVDRSAWPEYPVLVERWELAGDPAEDLQPALQLLGAEIRTGRLTLADVTSALGEAERERRRS